MPNFEYVKDRSGDLWTHASTGYNPLLILDYRVLCWKIFAAVEQYRGMLYSQKSVIDPETGDSKWVLDDDGSKDAEIETFIKLSWVALLNRGPDFLSIADYTVVVVDDTKAPFDFPVDWSVKASEITEDTEISTVHGYWRHKYLRDYWAEIPANKLPLARKRPKVLHTHESLLYKGGRAEKVAQWRSVADIGLSYITKKSGFHYLAAPYFEADDFAGALVAAKYEYGAKDCIRDREIYLYTIDRDWEQLVDLSVIWCNTAVYPPRLRDFSAVLEDVKRKEKVTISHPCQIVDAKAKMGDKSDNLPPGSPREVIDLLDPPDEYNLLKSEHRTRILAIANDNRPNINPKACNSAFLRLRANGCPLVITSQPYRAI